MGDSSTRGGSLERFWKLQTPEALTQANPISGTKYVLFGPKSGVRLLGVHVQTTWTLQPSPLELHGLVDGKVLRWYINNPVSATAYHAYTDEFDSLTTQPLWTTSRGADRAFMLDAKSCKLEIEITGGTVQELKGRVWWARKL